MKLKTLKEVQHLLKTLTEVEDKIQQYNKIVLKTINKEYSIQLICTATNDSKVIIDDNGDLLDAQRQSATLWGERIHTIIMGGTPPVKPTENKIQVEVDETEFLQIVGILIGKLNNQRNSIIKQLQTYGVK